MVSRPRRARLVLGVIALAVIGLGVWRGEALYWWVMTHRFYIESRRSMISSIFSSRGPNMRGWMQVPQWSAEGWPDSNHVRGATWYVDSGFKAEELSVRDSKLCITKWKPDGSVAEQYIGIQAGKDQSQESAPWLWGVTDQTEPTMPAWMKDDKLWAKALEEAR